MIPLATRFKAVVHYTHFLNSLRKVSKLYNVSKSSLHRWIRNDPRALAVAKQVSRKRRVSAFASVQDIIKEEMEANPFMTMNGLSRVLKERCGLNRARTTVGRYRAACGFAWKKAFRTVVPKHDPQRVQAFCEAHLSCRENLVCIDEACFYVGDHPKRGYSQRGRRLTVATSRTVRRTKYTLLMAVARTGLVHYKILDHNCKKPDFVQFIGELDVPHRQGGARKPQGAGGGPVSQGQRQGPRGGAGH
jgi:transposase